MSEKKGKRTQSQKSMMERLEGGAGEQSAHAHTHNPTKSPKLSKDKVDVAKAMAKPAPAKVDFRMKLKGSSESSGSTCRGVSVATAGAGPVPGSSREVLIKMMRIIKLADKWHEMTNKFGQKKVYVKVAVAVKGEGDEGDSSPNILR